MMRADAGEGQRSTMDHAITLAEVAGLRQAAYRLFAAFFHYPEEDRLRPLVGVGTAFRSEEERFSVLFPFYLDWKRMLDRLTSLKSDDVRASSGVYRRFFYAHADDPLCPPFESYYRRRAGEDTSGLPTQLLQRYRQAGLALAPGMEQPPDHAVVQLEFMAFMCGYESSAWQGAVSDSGPRTLKREAAFLRRHLGWWFPSFAWRVIHQDPDGFYGAVARAAEAFVHYDHDLIGLLVVSAGDPQLRMSRTLPNES